ncbi:hypothetical protein MASR1M90_23730 [Desulfovibrionales bacterium]
MKKFTRTSQQNITIADSWDVWPLDDRGCMIAVFRNGCSAVLSSVDGPIVWADEEIAVAYLTRRFKRLSRTRKLI